MALTLEEKNKQIEELSTHIRRIEKLMKTANNEDYLDLYQTLQGIKRDIVLEGLRELSNDSSDEVLQKLADEIIKLFS